MDYYMFILSIFHQIYSFSSTHTKKAKKKKEKRKKKKEKRKKKKEKKESKKLISKASLNFYFI